MSIETTVRVFIWHPDWDCDSVEVLSEDWPKGIYQLPIIPTMQDAMNFANAVHDKTGLCCTVETTTKATYP